MQLARFRQNPFVGLPLFKEADQETLVRLLL
jgi:hypothetical protein